MAQQSADLGRRSVDQVIPFSQPDLGPLEAQKVQEAMESGWISYRSPFVQKFEDAFARKANQEAALACSSGFAALVLGLHTLTDYIIEVPALTFAATAHAVLWANNQLHVADVDSTSWRPAHSVDLPVWLFGGNSPPKKIPCVIDACQAVDQLENLTHGPLYAFSFFANKALTTGEGGMLVGPAKLIAEARLWRDHGQTQGVYQHVRPGANFRMGGLQAAVGLAQLSRFNELIDARQQRLHRYQAYLPWTPRGLWQPAIEVADAAHCVRYLATQGIEARQCFPSLTQLPYLTHLPKCPVAESLSQRIIFLPMSSRMTLLQHDCVLRALEAYAEFSSDSIPGKP